MLHCHRSHGVHCRVSLGWEGCYGDHLCHEQQEGQLQGFTQYWMQLGGLLVKAG
jgi:hypothetical protein